VYDVHYGQPRFCWSPSLEKLPTQEGAKAKDAEACANVFTTWQKIKKIQGERVEELDRNDPNKRPISPNSVAATSQSEEYELRTDAEGSFQWCEDGKTSLK
jgi:hypothetical protein